MTETTNKRKNLEDLPASKKVVKKMCLAKNDNSTQTSFTDLIEANIIYNIFEKEIDKDITLRMKDVEIIQERIIECRKDLDLLRKAVVSVYYDSTYRKTTKLEQHRIHPAVQKLIGKSPSTSHLTDELFEGGARPLTRNMKKESVTELGTMKIEDQSCNVDCVTTNDRIPQFVTPNSTTSKNNAETCLPHGNKQKKQIRILVGNVSKRVTDGTYDKATHKWMLYVRSTGPEFEKEVSKVRFFLHSSYKPHDVVTVPKAPFTLTRRGWGEFPVRIQLQFHNPMNKTIDILHHLKFEGLSSGPHSRSVETTADIWLYCNSSDKNGTTLPTNHQLSKYFNNCDNQISEINNPIFTGIYETNYLNPTKDIGKETIGPINIKNSTEQTYNFSGHSNSKIKFENKTYDKENVVSNESKPFLCMCIHNSLNSVCFECSNSSVIQQNENLLENTVILDKYSIFNNDNCESNETNEVNEQSRQGYFDLNSFLCLNKNINFEVNNLGSINFCEEFKDILNDFDKGNNSQNWDFDQMSFKSDLKNDYNIQPHIIPTNIKKEDILKLEKNSDFGNIFDGELVVVKSEPSPLKHNVTSVSGIFKKQNENGDNGYSGIDFIKPVEIKAEPNLFHQDSNMLYNESIKEEILELEECHMDWGTEVINFESDVLEQDVLDNSNPGQVLTGCDMVVSKKMSLETSSNINYENESVNKKVTNIKNNSTLSENTTKFNEKILVNGHQKCMEISFSVSNHNNPTTIKNQFINTKSVTKIVPSESSAAPKSSLDSNELNLQTDNFKSALFENTNKSLYFDNFHDYFNPVIEDLNHINSFPTNSPVKSSDTCNPLLDSGRTNGKIKEVDTTEFLTETLQANTNVPDSTSKKTGSTDLLTDNLLFPLDTKISDSSKMVMVSKINKIDLTSVILNPILKNNEVKPKCLNNSSKIINLSTGSKLNCLQIQSKIPTHSNKDHDGSLLTNGESKNNVLTIPRLQTGGVFLVKNGQLIFVEKQKLLKTSDNKTHVLNVNSCNKTPVKLKNNSFIIKPADLTSNNKKSTSVLRVPGISLLKKNISANSTTNDKPSSLPPKSQDCLEVSKLQTGDQSKIICVASSQKGQNIQSQISLKTNHNIMDKKICLNKAESRKINFDARMNRLKNSISQLIENCKFTDTELSVRWLVKGLPLITPEATEWIYKVIHPYSAPSLTVFKSWPVPKQFASEWLRAKTVCRILEKICKPGSVWTTKQVLYWARYHGYSPLYNLPQGEENETKTVESSSLNDCDTFTLPDNILKWLQESSELENKKEECDIDVVGEVKNIHVKKIIKEEVADTLELRECEPQNNLTGFVLETVNKLGYSLARDHTDPDETFVGAALTVLTNTMTNFAEDLLRRSLAESFKRGGRSIEVVDTNAALCSRPEFDIFTNSGLGFVRPKNDVS
uniref:YEATS domain-containing protein n=1 Tax=Clastoptera arizonana TaxID=38151 RepID=A0A1B6C2D5_9HEMI